MDELKKEINKLLKEIENKRNDKADKDNPFYTHLELIRRGKYIAYKHILDWIEINGIKKIETE